MTENNLNTDNILSKTDLAENKIDQAKIIVNHDNNDLENENLNTNLKANEISENKNFDDKILNTQTVNVNNDNISYNFFEVVPLKSIGLYLGVFFIAILSQNFINNNHFEHNLFLLIINAILNLCTYIGLYNVFISSLKNLNILTKQYLNLDISQPKFNTYSKITLSLIIINSVLSQFDWLYIYNSKHHIDYAITNLLINNDAYLYILAKLSIFGNFCFAKMYIINWLFSFTWVFLYLKPLFEYYKNFKKLFPYKRFHRIKKEFTNKINAQQIINIIHGRVFINYTFSFYLLVFTFVYGLTNPGMSEETRNFSALIFFVQIGIWLAVAKIIKSIKVVLNSNEKNIETSDKNEIIIPYQYNSGVEKWFEQRFKLSSPGKKLIVLFSIVLIFFTNLGSQILTLITNFVSSTNFNILNTHNNITPMQIVNNLGVLSTFLLLIGAILASIFIYLYQKRNRPQFIKFTKQGFAFGRDLNNVKITDPMIHWDSIENITVANESKNSLSKSLIFKLDVLKNSQNNFHKQTIFESKKHINNPNFKLNLSCIPDLNHRELILKSIEKYAQHIPRDSSVIEILQPPSEHSYTDVWLQALASPPKRNNLKPLDLGDKLKDERYAVESYLGSGGQGSTYLAYDKIINERVVLKEFILPVFVDLHVRKDALSQFEAEAKILKKINHPNIVKLLDYFTQDHRAYLVLEYIDGITLKDLVLKDGPLPDKRVEEIALKLCNTLNYLHSQDPPIIHRDLTPDNIIYLSNNDIKIIDFNVARQNSSVTIVSKVVGKHAYMPPEQFQGLSSRQSDIYSLGASLYYLLTSTEPVPISQSNPQKTNSQINDKINNVVLKATAVKTENRYQDVSEIIEYLNH